MAGKTPFSLKSGFAQSRDILRVVAQVDQLVQAGSSASRTMKWVGSEKKWYSFSLEWTAIRMWVRTTPELTVYTMGHRGLVNVGNAKTSQEEQIDATLEGPQGRGDLRDLRWIGDHLYAVGMSRQVYRRIGAGQWERRDGGTVLPLGTKDPVAGFNAIDGLSEDDFTAVGFGGEIWRCRKGKWKKLDSPTNAVLYRVRVAEDGKAYAAGQNGILLRGDGDHWTVVEHEETEDDLWGMELFKGALYVAAEDAIYRLTAKDTLERLKLPKKMTCMHLHANDGVLWSTGQKNAAWTDDAVKWHDITP